MTSNTMQRKALIRLEISEENRARLRVAAQLQRDDNTPEEDAHTLYILGQIDKRLARLWSQLRHDPEDVG